MAANPYMHSFVLASGSTAYNLATLIKGDPNAPNLSVIQDMTVQVPLRSGNARIYLGNGDITATNCGTELSAGQAIAFTAVPPNWLNLQSSGTGTLSVLTDTAGTAINLILWYQA